MNTQDKEELKSEIVEIYYETVKMVEAQYSLNLDNLLKNHNMSIINADAILKGSIAKNFGTRANIDLHKTIKRLNYKYDAKIFISIDAYADKIYVYNNAHVRTPMSILMQFNADAALREYKLNRILK